MKILKMTAILGDNNLYKTEIYAEQDGKSFSSIMFIEGELMFGEKFGELIKASLVGQYDYLVEKIKK